MDSQAAPPIIKVTLLPQFINFNFHHLITLHLIITHPIPILPTLLPTPILTITPHLPHLLLIILNLLITITIKQVR